MLGGIILRERLIFCLLSGCDTFQGLRKFIMEKNVTRVLAFLHIAAHGLAGAGCSADGKILHPIFFIYFQILHLIVKSSDI